jgi:beta-xylosidase
VRVSYKNPVYPAYFADPVVWKHGDAWYAVGTGVIEAESHAGGVTEALTVEGKPGVFLLLRSEDFVRWTPIGSALELLAPDYGNAYWAPELAFADGKFWMYYSVGREDKAHHIRAAVSEKPDGPYRDTGSRITDPFTCPFAIDASPFQDEDGQWYLFYARDFLDTDDGARVGTALVVDRLVNMTTLAGEPRVVARPRFEWQRFLANRVMYGGVYDWHTLEGPCVRKRNGRYYCLFSGGRWENETYGVDYVIADHVLGPWSGQGMSERGARLLHTLPGQVIGPGHNCIAQGPGGRDFIVYHAWDPAMTARRMFIDPLDWTAEGPRCAGPTCTAQEVDA